MHFNKKYNFEICSWNFKSIGEDCPSYEFKQLEKWNFEKNKSIVFRTIISNLFATQIANTYTIKPLERFGLSVHFERSLNPSTIKAPRSSSEQMSRKSCYESQNLSFQILLIVIIIKCNVLKRYYKTFYIKKKSNFWKS